MAMPIPGVEITPAFKVRTLFQFNYLIIVSNEKNK